MPTYEISVATTFICDFTIDAHSRDEAIREAEDLASDSRTIYLQCSDNEVEILEVDQDEPSEEESEEE